MLVEHTFVTTLDKDAAFEQAVAALAALGFAQVERTEVSVTLRRGKAKINRVVRSDDLPQQVVVHFDRGRIQFAASLEESPALRRERPLQQEFLMTLATLTEACLSRREPLQRARAAWDLLADRIERSYHRRRRRNRIGLGIVLLILFGFIALIAWLVAVQP
jgi:hypothetical protein